jgi:hypothetical protein
MMLSGGDSGSEPVASWIPVPKVQFVGALPLTVTSTPMLLLVPGPHSRLAACAGKIAIEERDAAIKPPASQRIGAPIQTVRFYSHAPTPRRHVKHPNTGGSISYQRQIWGWRNNEFSHLQQANEISIEIADKAEQPHCTGFTSWICQILQPQRIAA